MAKDNPEQDRLQEDAFEPEATEAGVPEPEAAQAETPEPEPAQAETPEPKPAQADIFEPEVPPDSNPLDGSNGGMRLNQVAGNASGTEQQ